MPSRRTVVAAGVLTTGGVISAGALAARYDLRDAGGDGGTVLRRVSVLAQSPGSHRVRVVVRRDGRTAHDRSYTVEGPDDEDPDDGVVTGTVAAVPIERTWSGRGEYVVVAERPGGTFDRVVLDDGDGGQCVRIAVAPGVRADRTRCLTA